MLEAMAVGCVLIGSDTAPVKEVLQSGTNGYLVPFFDTKSIAESVADALGNRGKQLRIRQAARRTVVEKYDLYGTCLPMWLELIQP